LSQQLRAYILKRWVKDRKERKELLELLVRLGFPGQIKGT
jgi:hypothetical protein